MHVFQEGRGDGRIFCKKKKKVMTGSFAVRKICGGRLSTLRMATVQRKRLNGKACCRKVSAGGCDTVKVGVMYTERYSGVTGTVGGGLEFKRVAERNWNR